MRLAPLVLAACISFGPAADARTFEEAVNHWLALEDEKALPMLAGLAAAGDERAMLLLAMLDQDWAQSDWLMSLGRKERNALMRAPGGLSGRSWLTKVKDQRELADALISSPGVDDFARRAEALFRLGETAAGARVAMTAFNIDPGALADIAGKVSLPAKMNYLLWFSAGFDSNPAFFAEGGTRPMTEAEKALIAQMEAPGMRDGYQQRMFASFSEFGQAGAGQTEADARINKVLRTGEMLAADNPEAGPPVGADGEPAGDRLAAYEAAGDILMTAPELAPMRAICDTACPDAPRECLRTLYGETGGAGTMVFQGPPLATLIAEAEYYASPRYIEDLRQVALPADKRPSPAPSYAACGMAILHPEP